MIWFLIFFATPIAEMYLLIEVAGYINTLPTIGLVMLTAVIGVFLLKRQGLSTLTRGVTRLNRGEMPAQEMAEGLLLAMAGALLITPGFITDTFGFLIIAPITRGIIARWVLKHMTVQGMSAGAYAESQSAFQAHHASQNPHGGDLHRTPPRQSGSGATIEGDFERKS